MRNMTKRELFDSCRAISAAAFVLVSFGVAAAGIGCSNSAPKPPPPPEVEKAPLFADYEHHVGAGETLAAISTWYTGKPTNWSAIKAANPGLNPQRLRLGQTIIIPGALVVRREPLPRSFLKDRVPKSVRKDAPGTGDAGSNGGKVPGADATDRPADYATGDDRPFGGDVPDSGEVSNTKVAPVAKEPPPADVEDLLGDATAKNNPPPAEKGGSAPAANGAGSGGQKPGTAGGGSDAEREKLLDELLSQ